MGISLPPDYKVLVVDDLPANLLIVRGLLAPYGFIVDTAGSGQEAIEKVRNHGYDIILMDHMMPEMDGIEATAAIRTWEKELAEKSVEFPVEAPKLLELPKGVPIIARFFPLALSPRHVLLMLPQCRPFQASCDP